MLHLHIKTS